MAYEDSGSTFKVWGIDCHWSIPKGMSLITDPLGRIYRFQSHIKLLGQSKYIYISKINLQERKKQIEKHKKHFYEKIIVRTIGGFQVIEAVFKMDKSKRYGIDYFDPEKNNEYTSRNINFSYFSNKEFWRMFNHCQQSYRAKMKVPVFDKEGKPKGETWLLEPGYKRYRVDYYCLDKEEKNCRTEVNDPLPEALRKKKKKEKPKY